MADDEIVAVVDENNTVIDATTRKQMRDLGLIHRATYVFVFNTAGLLYLQKRTLSKDMYPGYFDAAAGGVVLVGESYAASAEREAGEELGIYDTLLEHRFEFFYEDSLNRIWGSVFTCRYDGRFVHQLEEVDSGFFVSVKEVLAARYKPVSPDTLKALRKLVAKDPFIGQSS